MEVEIRKNEMEDKKFFADVICEMVKTMMIEDKLNINECYNALSEYYNIPENKLRMLVHSQYKKTKDKKYLYFSYDYIMYDSKKRKFITRNNIAMQYKGILEKIANKLNKKFGELNYEQQNIVLEEIINFAKGVK